MTAEPGILRFGLFELDGRREELRREGVLVKLTPQQFRVLRFLVENAGQVCAREQIRQEIWGAGTFVDFDRGLNVAIAQIRAALRDDSESPRFIQTVPRRGYRFLAEVQGTGASVPAAAAPAARRRMLVPAAGAAAVVAAALFLWRANGPEVRTMIAVLPFENTTGEQADGVLLDGLLDELITQFGTLLPERLGATGRTSVMHYQGGLEGLPRIAAELRVAYVLEGDLRREGERRRISLRLVRAADQAQVWNDTYDCSDCGALEFQEDAAARTGAAVLRALFPQTPAGPRGHRPSPAAREAFLNGRYQQHKGTRADWERAVGWFDRAAQLDAAYAEPRAAAAEANVALALSGASPAAEALERARTLAEAAVRIDEGSAEGHNALGSVAMWRDWDFAAARRHFERALALNPSFAQAHHDYAFLQVVTGHAEAGIASLKRAQALDPLSPRVNVDAGWVLLQAHRFDEAIASARRALALEPGLREAEACIARAELYQGKRAAAQFFTSDLESADPWRRAVAAAESNRPGDALAALATARAQHHLLMPLAATEPAFAALHGDPHFPRL